MSGETPAWHSYGKKLIEQKDDSESEILSYEKKSAVL
jgi:hypothetical protein